MPSALGRRAASALLPFVLVAVVIVSAAQLDGRGARSAPPPAHRADLAEAAPVGRTIVRPTAPPHITTSTTSTTTTTIRPAPPPPPPTPAQTVTPPTVVAAPAPAPPPAGPSAVPPIGRATASGCTAALVYLQAYAAKGFSLECPGYAEGRQAMTCMLEQGACPGSAVIAIADPCPEAYMNEASNSLVLTGAAKVPIDPYGPCP